MGKKLLVVNVSDYGRIGAVKSKDGAWVLVHNHDNSVVVIGSEVPIGTAGEVATVTGGAPPHRLGSTGRVYVTVGKSSREYFPSVAGCRWAVVQREGVSG